MKSILFAIILTVLSQASHTQQTNTKETLIDTITIRLDNVAFEENAYMNVLDSENNTIAYFDRFENKSGPVKAVRLFNLKKELIYVLVPLITDNGYKIHIRNKDKSRGFVNLTENIKGLAVSYQSEVEYFQEPYSFDYSINIGIGKASVKETVNYKNKEVISYKEKISAFSGVKTSPFVVRKSFFLDNKIDVANWVLVIQLIEELSSEVSKNRRNKHIAGFN